MSKIASFNTNVDTLLNFTRTPYGNNWDCAVNALELIGVLDSTEAECWRFYAFHNRGYTK